MNIVVLDGYTLNPGDVPWAPLEALGTLTVHERTKPEDVVTRAKDADIVFVNKCPVSREAIQQLPRLKAIGVLATGYDIVDVKAAGERGIPVFNAAAYGVDSVAQHALALLLELCRHTALHDASVRRGEWANSADWCYWHTPQIELAGLTMGLIGFGNNGRRVGELAHAFGMRVIAYTEPASNPPDWQPFAFVDLDTLFKEADVISLHCPLTDQTRHIINAANIARMKPGVMIINTARGPLLNEEDVAQALKAGKLGGLGTDVLTVEPPQADSPLLGAPNTLITPHIAWASRKARENIMQIAADNVRAFLAGKAQSVVNTQWL